MNVVFQLDFAGAADSEDVLAARHIIFLENQRRSRLTPPGTPLPFSNAAQIKAGYLGLLLAQITAQHLSNANLAKGITGLAVRLTQAERDQLFANVTARLNAGETVAAIIADTAA